MSSYRWPIVAALLLITSVAQQFTISNLRRTVAAQRELLAIESEAEAPSSEPLRIAPIGPFRAYYSRAMAENGYGTNFYKRADGTEVEATVVVRVGQSWGDRWLDKEDRGIVVEWSRPGCPRVRQDSAW